MLSRRPADSATAQTGAMWSQAGLRPKAKSGSVASTPIHAFRLVGIAFVLYLGLVGRLAWNSAGDGREGGDTGAGFSLGATARIAKSVFSFGDELIGGEVHGKSEHARISHVPVRSDTKLFVTMGSYVMDGNAESGSHPSLGTDDLILVLIGVGDFTKKPQPSSEAALKIPPKVPKGLKMILRDKKSSETYEFSNVVFHSNGTAYQGKISPSRGALYFGERAVWIATAVPRSATSLQQRLVTNTNEFEVKVVIETDQNERVFDSQSTTPSLVLSTHYDKPQFNLTLCSSAIYGLTGSKWIIEYLEYHRAAGFDSMDLYVHEVGPLVTQVLDKYVRDNSNGFFVRIHDWTAMIDNGPVGFNDHTGVGHGVQGDAWEHGQRLTRNDCYLRNRGRSNWIMFSDVDELFTSKMPGKTVWEGPIQSFCEPSFQQNPDHIACSFSSVTTPPNAKTTDDSLLILERIDTSESSCQSPYNCGRFHYGREKYAIRTARGTLNPNGPFFYHAISQNYDISERHHVLVPNTMGVVRHYAGHFSHSRKGGLAPNKAMLNPLPRFVIDRMRKRIFDEDSELGRLYKTPGQSENFLKLYAITDLWRFAKPGERPPEAVNIQELTSTTLPPPSSSPPQQQVKEAERYLTFEYFGGRLNNQLWTLDWVFRVALALNRTAVIGYPRTREHYIGWPSSPSDASLWDIEALRRAPFKFKFAWEITDDVERTLVFGDKEALPSECVWDFNESGKYLMLWAARSECTHRRIHFSSGGGLVHSYKADTRKYGVDPLVFWRHMRLNREVIAAIHTWWSSTSPRGELEDAVGLHFRSWREANGDAAHARKVCKRLSQKMLTYAAKHFDALRGECATQCAKRLEYVDVEQFWRDHQLDVTCEPASTENVRTICGRSGLDQVERGEMDFFVATDHETREADEVFESLNARMMYKVAMDAFVDRFIERDQNGLQVRKYARSILPILLDLGALIQVGRFYGSPASTLSQAVCLWRRAFGKREEVPGMCQLVWYSTISDVCDELCYEGMHES